MTISRAEQAVVADLDEPFGKHVLEETADELRSRYSGALDLVGGRFFVRESY
jgi:hypothetical protein